MTPTRLLIGQILIVFAIMTLGVWAATQWAAPMLGYQTAIGALWFRIGAWPVYRPWALFLWWFHFEAYAIHVFDKAGVLAGASGVIEKEAPAETILAAIQKVHEGQLWLDRVATGRQPAGERGVEHPARPHHLDLDQVNLWFRAFVTSPGRATCAATAGTTRGCTAYIESWN